MRQFLFTFILSALFGAALGWLLMNNFGVR